MIFLHLQTVVPTDVLGILDGVVTEMKVEHHGEYARDMRGFKSPVIIGTWTQESTGEGGGPKRPCQFGSEHTHGVGPWFVLYALLFNPGCRWRNHLGPGVP